jgi:hypothetical protein
VILRLFGFQNTDKFDRLSLNAGANNAAEGNLHINPIYGRHAIALHLGICNSHSHAPSQAFELKVLPFTPRLELCISRPTLVRIYLQIEHSSVHENFDKRDNL